MNNDKNPNIVAIGGGTGLSTLLSGLRYFPVNINAVVTVSDDGGSSGKLKNIFNIPSPGDVRNVIVSLSNAPKEWQRLLQYRFENTNNSNDELYGHTIGNLILTALTKMNKNNFLTAVRKMSRLLSVDGNVYPVSYSSSNLCAIDNYGNIIKGESNFSKNFKRIEKVFYEDPIIANKDALNAISKADAIILGPGSLYTSILPNIIIETICKEINNNQKAELIYVCNIMTEKGETSNYTAIDHINSLKRHGIKKIHKILINKGKVPNHILQLYKKNNSKLVNLYEEDNTDYEVVTSDLVQLVGNVVRHHPIKTAAVIYSMIMEKYRNYNFK